MTNTQMRLIRMRRKVRKKEGFHLEAKRQKERSALGWVMTFAGTHRGLYAVSVAVAAVGVVCGIIPYFIMGDMIHRLVEGDRNWQAYLASGLAMAVFWTARVVFHSISTACSHQGHLSRAGSAAQDDVRQAVPGPVRVREGQTVRDAEEHPDGEDGQY